ncbi:MAG: sel1 repeat family protein, partial [Lentisphaeria bacterium]|nr:sel1 repeat family protein [Lentisphaeria bacterium]
KGDARAMERIGYLYENGLGVKKSFPIAIAKYEKAAEHGNSAAMIALGRMLENGIGMTADLAKAAAWYRSAVANDSAVAQRKLAEFLFLGKGMEKDWPEALRLARLASNQGDADAVALLGRAYEEGWGVEPDGEKAKELYQKAADKGSALGKSCLANLEAEAQYRNGLKAMEGNGTVQDFAAAKVWFEKAAAQGSIGAMEELGFLCERGLGGDVDIPRAKEWYEKAAAQGNAAAMVGLGKMYFRGYDGIAQDYPQSLIWFKKAAAIWRTAPEESRWKVIYLFFYLGRIYTEGLGGEKNVMTGLRAFLTGANNGNICCAHRLAVSYEIGKFTSKSPDDSKRWYNVCARAENSVGYADDMAMRTISLLYLYGDGVEKDLEVSRDWARKAAALGNVQCLSELGNAYLTGSGVPKNEPEGLSLLEAAACRGYYYAQKTLGILYYNGKKVSMDHTKALYWLEKAAALGSGEAMEMLSRMYRNGEGVEKSEAEALQWLKKSAENDYPFSYAALGWCYETGELGCEVNLDRAIELYKKAAENRSMRGRYELGRCYLKGIGVDRNREEAFKLLGNAVAAGTDELKYYQKATSLVADMFFENGDFKTNESQFNLLDPELNQKVLYRLHWRFRSGDGVPKNIGKAVLCLTAAAEHGNKNAQNSLGWMYYKGENIERNAKRAYEWTMKAVQNGNPNGMETLFRMYRDGDGVTQNHVEALKWLEVVTRNPDEQGVASSELGECYEYGLLGLTRDERKAFALYYKSSQKSKCPGKYNRGRCHLYGIGTPVDIPRAIEWLTKAAEKEDSDDHKYDLLAMKLLIDLYTEGRVVEKDDAKAREWQTKLDELKKKRTEEIPGYVSPV